MRLDLYLYKNSYAESRTRAVEIIKKGGVKIDGKLISKPSYEYSGDGVIEVETDILKYVSRGGYKLEGALDSFQIDVTGLVCVDIGASTGGFTDCLLKYGAKCVYAVDSGTQQLSDKLRDDKRVVSIENFNARNLDDKTLGEKCDLAVMDVSFISQTLLYEAVSKVLKEDGIFVSLIKPQFEVGKAGIGKNGIVKDDKTRLAVIDRLKKEALEKGLILQKTITSPIRGKDGNIEFLGYFTKQS